MASNELNINNTITIDAEHEVVISKIYDSNKDVFDLVVDDGSMFEVKRNSKFGVFLNRHIRKKKLNKINDKNRNNYNSK